MLRSGKRTTLLSVSFTADVAVQQLHYAGRQALTQVFCCAVVEQITSKAGSFKPSAVFLRMLLAGLRQESGSVGMNLLSYEDLESPSSSSLGGEGEHPSLSNRRYLILTYSSEFDRIQYPLPLQYVSSPDPAYLKSIIQDLRSSGASSRTPEVCPDPCFGGMTAASCCAQDARACRWSDTTLAHSQVRRSSCAVTSSSCSASCRNRATCNMSCRPPALGAQP